MIIISALLGGVVAIWKLYPEQVNNAAYIAVVGIAALVGFSIFVPSYIGRGYPHILHILLSWPQLVPYVRSLFVEYEEVEPLGKILDIVPLMTKDQRGYDIPKWWGNRWYYPYLVKTMNQIDTPRYGDCEYHVFIFPEPWDKWFGRPKEMPLGAELYGELFTHPSTSWLVSIMCPFPVKHLGLEIPVYLGIAANKSVENITADWIPTMREAARYVDKFDDIMEQFQERVYPFKEIEMLGQDILTPEAKKKMDELLKRGKLMVAPKAK